MARIAKKPRSVKGQKKAKRSPPRVSIRTDARNRRYAIDTRTGKRIPIARAEQALARAKRAIPRNIPPKTKKPPKAPSKPRPKKRPKKVKKPSKKRSEVAKKGWETRRKKALTARIPGLLPEVIPRPPSSEELMEKYAPLGVVLETLGPERLHETIVERAARYPKVREAANRAWVTLIRDSFLLQAARLTAWTEEKPMPPPTATRRWDQVHGIGDADRIRFQEFAQAQGVGDIDQIIDRLLEEDGEYTIRELYTLYFSPEVA